MMDHCPRGRRGLAGADPRVLCAPLHVPDAQLDAGSNVLIHCLAGAHRAGTAGIACLMHLCDLDSTAVTAIAQAARPAIWPIGSFPRLLDALDRARVQAVRPGPVIDPDPGSDAAAAVGARCARAGIEPIAAPATEAQAIEEAPAPAAAPAAESQAPRGAKRSGAKSGGVHIANNTSTDSRLFEQAKEKRKPSSPADTVR